MGDFYNVTLEAYHDWDRTQAIKRCQMHGHRLDDIHRFFAQFPAQEEWTEVELCIVITDYQSAIYEDPGFLIRVLEEAIWGYQTDDNPIRAHYPELWQEGFGITDDNPSILWIMSQTYHEGEKVFPKAGGSRDEALEARFLYPTHFTPDLTADRAPYAGRGWYTNCRDHLQDQLHYGKRWAACRLLTRDLIINKPTRRENNPQELVQHITSSRKAIEQTLPALTPQPHTIECRETNDGLELTAGNDKRWLLQRDGTLGEHHGQRDKTSCCRRSRWRTLDASLLLTRQDGTTTSYPLPHFASSEGTSDWLLLLNANQQPIVVTTQRLAQWQHSSAQWQTVEHQINRPHTAIFGSDDALWFANDTQLCCYQQNGQMRHYGPANGLLGELRCLIALPHGVIWLITSDQYNRLQQTHTHTHRIFPRKDAYDLSPERAWTGARGPDGSIWLVTEYGQLLRLIDGEIPRYYAFDEILPCPRRARWDRQKPLFHVDAQGNLFFLHRGEGYWIHAETITACDAQSPCNESLFLPGQLKPFQAPKPLSNAPQYVDLREARFHSIGKLHTLTQKQLKTELASFGAMYSNTLSSKVSHVIRGSNTQQYASDWYKRRRYWDRLEEAEMRFLPIYTEAELLRLLANATPTPNQ